MKFTLPFLATLLALAQTGSFALPVPEKELLCIRFPCQPGSDVHDFSNFGLELKDRREESSAAFPATTAESQEKQMFGPTATLLRDLLGRDENSAASPATTAEHAADQQKQLLGVSNWHSRRPPRRSRQARRKLSRVPSRSSPGSVTPLAAPTLSTVFCFPQITADQQKQTIGLILDLLKSL
ncbi:hypothetical protein LshimejAT787_0200970 [Lyophyllum shimeji]|uniref:Uncharacterized protein n=1 Tax=Lyophyllum shimeji TaxID=47721 RepID=A0A9P3PFN0_LYOSH|nr:hypothetical protein LshimejAT787_0200970 [Lyophyllum shimeji]